MFTLEADEIADSVDGLRSSITIPKGAEVEVLASTDKGVLINYKGRELHIRVYDNEDY